MAGNFDLEKLMSIPLFFLFTLSHDKKKMAFYWDKTGRMELFVMDMATRQVEQVTDGEFPRDIKSGFIWDRDNETIVYAKDDSGAEKNDLFSFNIRTKENRDLSINREIQEYIADSSPDGEWYTFNSLRAGQMNIFKMRTDGSEIQQLTAHENPAFGGTYSPDGKNIVYGSNEEGDLRNSDIYLVTPGGESVERVVQLSVGSKENFGEWHPDSRSFAFSSDIDGMARPGIYNMDTKEAKLLGDQAYNEFPTRFSKDGSKLFCLVNHDASIYPSVYDLSTGERKIFDFPRGIAAGGEITEEGKLVMTLNTSNKPSELILLNPETQKIETLMKTDLTGIDDSLFVTSDYIHYPSTLESNIPAIVFKPRNYDPNKKYPAIVGAHGGPTAQYFSAFMAMAQYYADNGYVVLYPNVRGSTGYGAEFRDSCLKDWGGKDLEDWAAGRQYLIDHYSADPDRIAITGGSYGGYATLISVGCKPDLWKVGAALVPISHLQTLYEDDMPHFKYYLRQQMGDPVKDKDLWEERSPINYADKVTAKMLLLHGENDPRCPVGESRNYVKALKEAGKVEGKDFEYVEIKDQGHGMYTDRAARVRDSKILSEFIISNL